MVVMSGRFRIPKELKVKLIITDQFSIHDFNVPIGTYRDFSITQLSLLEVKSYVNQNESYFNEPHLFTKPCRKIYSHILECDITMNRTDGVKLDDDTTIIYITLNNDLNPIYYLIT